MKNYLLSISFIFALAFNAIGQTTLVDFETVKDPFVEPFNLTSYESAVANPSATGVNTSAFVGKVVKDGASPWGGSNIYFGGDVVFTGINDKFSVDFYTEATPLNDTIRFQFQLFPRDGVGGAATIDVNAYYVDANDNTLGTWKTLDFPIPDGTTGSYNQMVIFFGWDAVGDGEIVYFDNIVAPGFSAYENSNITFDIEDKFNNAIDVKLFLDGTEATLTQTDNVYSNTTSLSSSYSVLVGGDVDYHEVVYSHMANGAEVRDTLDLLVGPSRDLFKLIIVEEIEDGTALAISVGDTPPTIDGTIDAVWSNAKTHTMQERSWWGSPTGLYSTWKVMWDIDNIYLLFTVEDATPNNGNTVDVYQNDCIEVFFDMNQSATTPYDANDWQIRTIRGLDTWTGSANVDATWAADLERGQSAMADDAGYIIEMAIPWSSLSTSFLPLASVEFNFDCCAADVTTAGGTRVFRESWTTAEDIAYMNTKDFGTITLSDLTNEITSIKNISQIPNLSVYPNPVIDHLNIQAASYIAKVEIYDIMGRQASILSDINQTSVIMNVSDLSRNAIYIVKITDVQGNSSARKITVK